MAVPRWGWRHGNRVGACYLPRSTTRPARTLYSLPYAGVRAATQVQTPAGIVLYVGAIGTGTTVAVHSILYDTGCSPVTVQQNGLLPVLATINLSTTYPP